MINTPPITIGIMQIEPNVKQNRIRALMLTPTHKSASA